MGVLPEAFICCGEFCSFPILKAVATKKLTVCETLPEAAPNVARGNALPGRQSPRSWGRHTKIVSNPSYSLFIRSARDISRSGRPEEQGLATTSCIVMEFAAAQQPLRDVGGLKRRALGGRMGCKVARHGN